MWLYSTLYKPCVCVCVCVCVYVGLCLCVCMHAHAFVHITFFTENRATGTNLNNVFKHIYERILIFNKTTAGFEDHRHVILIFTDGNSTSISYSQGSTNLFVVECDTNIYCKPTPNDIGLIGLYHAFSINL